jgi:hypothetical protein
MTASPFADPDVDAASGTFVKMEDLMGRHVIIVPKAIEEKEGTNPAFGNSKYNVAISDLIVLDGRKTEKITEVPLIQYDFWVTGFAVIAELRKYVGTGTPVLGYLGIKGKGYFFEPAGKDVAEAASTKKAWEQYEDERAANKVPPF